MKDNLSIMCSKAEGWSSGKINHVTVDESTKVPYTALANWITAIDHVISDNLR